jgi:hypothetical protein
MRIGLIDADVCLKNPCKSAQSVASASQFGIPDSQFYDLTADEEEAIIAAQQETPPRSVVSTGKAADLPNWK